MNRHNLTKLVVVLAMLLSIAGGPALASSGMTFSGKSCVTQAGCCDMPCCAVKDKQHGADELPAPVGQQVGQEIAAAVMAAPFNVLFSVTPAEARRVPKALFAAVHGREPRAASCIRLI